MHMHIHVGCVSMYRCDCANMAVPRREMLNGQISYSVQSVTVFIAPLVSCFDNMINHCAMLFIYIHTNVGLCLLQNI